MPLTPRPTGEGSRDRVLAALRTSRVPQPVPALCADTGLSATAVRFHLERLLQAGVTRVTRDPDHRGPGRPALLYTALPREAVDPAAAYRMLAGLLARELPTSGRAKAAVAAGRAWAAQLPASSESGSPVAAVAALLARTGFDPVLAGDGNTIELHNCPFMELAVEQPEVICGVHLGLAQGVLAATGSSARVRLTPALDTPGPCLVHVSPPARRGASRSVATARIEAQVP
jgi:predicted ArsR family transcriptional regulator